MKNNSEKVIAVTGGGSGIGEAIVKRLSQEGAKVALIDLDKDNGLRIAKDLDGVAFFNGDVTDAEAIQKVFADIVQHYGRLDGAVNNAGIGGAFIPTADYPVDAWRKVLSVNLDGVFHCLRAQLPIMASQGAGAIVNMSSICGFVGQAGTSAYVASKHAVLGLTKTVALEYGLKGIRCNAVCPTYVKTPLTLAELDDPAIWADLDAKHCNGRCARPEEVAAMVSFLLSEDASAVNGSSHKVDAGYTAA